MKHFLFTTCCLITGMLSAQPRTIFNQAAPGTISSSPTVTGKRIHFVPDSFYSVFSSGVPPVLHILPGDTIETESIDADGFDMKGVSRSKGVNPLTGPFYIERAMPGDVVAVHITKMHINRPWATGAEFFVPRSLPDSILKKLPAAHSIDWNMAVRWQVDPVIGRAWPDSPRQHLKNFYVPVKPMLGCVGLAPQGKEISTIDAGPFGGNMDFSLITKGATVYLPVFHPGGLLFMGDAHAMQGDGELNMAALEISMEFDFTVELFPHQQLAYPMVEDSAYMMTVGLAEHLDDAFKIANAGMLSFLQSVYGLSDTEAAQVMGSSLEYQIPEITDPQTEVVAKIKKSRLSLLSRQ
jgi:amidase